MDVHSGMLADISHANAAAVNVACSCAHGSRLGHIYPAHAVLPISPRTSLPRLLGNDIRELCA